MGKPARLITIAIVIAVMLYAAVVSLSYSLSGELNHDEHQFMSSAFMVAQFGRHPYIDFAYFHMPNLVYLYAPFFFTPYPFLLARIFVGIFGFGICLIIFLHGRSVLAKYGKLISITIPICIIFLLLSSTLYRLAISHVWNHMPATFFALSAFLLHCRGIRSINKLQYFLFSGLSLGMAIGIRLSFAPLVIPFLLTLTVVGPGTIKSKARQALIFCIGILSANAAAIYFFFTAYQDFWFGNIGYARLNTLFRQEMSLSRAMTLGGKLNLLNHLFIQTSSELVILLSCIYSLSLLAIARIRKPGRLKFELLFVLVSLPFLLLGALAPSPSWDQYYFALVPFLSLLPLYALSSLHNIKYPAAVILPFVLFVVSHGTPRFPAGVFTNLQSWTPIILQNESEEIRNHIVDAAKERTVLTISPLYAVSSNLPIYEEFVTGPFAWRVSHLISEEKAIKRGMPLRSRINSFVKERRPVAILTGKSREGWVEIPLNEVAKDFGYHRIETSSGAILWLSTE